jgi:Protein of unknown function (DUF3179)
MPKNSPRRIHVYGALVLGIALGAISTFIAVDKWQTYKYSTHSPGPLPVRQVDADGFSRVTRSGSVDLEATYNLDNLQIPLGEIHTLLPKDAIPSLTDPKMESVASSSWLDDSDRVIDVTVNDESVAVPLKILNFHEVSNMIVGGKPVAATYCPLCDSTTVISREVTHNGKTQTLEFGVSGALYNSNVLMYDRQTLGLWSQLGLRCVSGPLAGAALEHLPMRVVPWSQFKLMHSNGKVLSNDTGYERPYDQNAYEGYFQRDDTLVPVRGIGNALTTKKTRGVGVMQDGKAWFITSKAIGDGYTLETPDGPVTVSVNEAGIYVDQAPKGTSTVQTFYYSWSAFYPQTEVIAKDEERSRSSKNTGS